MKPSNKELRNRFDAQERVQRLWSEADRSSRLNILTELAKYDREGNRRYRGKLGGVLAEFRILLDACGRQSMRGGRNISFKTAADRKDICRDFLITLHEKGFNVCRLRNLERKHIVVLVSSWIERQHTAATIGTKTSTLRWLYQSIGKEHLVRDMDEYFTDPSVRRRPQRTETDKSLASIGMDFAEIYQRASTESELFAAQLSLSYWFGMRPKESWLWRPHSNVDDETRTLEIRFGTKGGRPRVYPQRLTDEEMAVVIAARQLVPHIHGSMIPATLSMKEWNSKYYFWCKKIGLTKKDLGVTAYSLRHSRAHAEWTSVTGVEVPVRAPGENVDPSIAKLGYLRTAELLGHARPEIAAHYTG